ncbi:MAG: ABC transporter substrate-binding protein, partial [Oscillospiraceae bacterium]|nr:ABC transporter substrate-binding protein [Oscillospiraceae bacterium]
MKKLIALVLALSLALVLVACGTSTSKESPEASAEASTAVTGGKIGVAMPTKSLERWNRDGSFLQKQFEAKGYTVELVYSDNDAAKQVNDLENLIADKVN